MAESDQDKTEAPTPRKRQEAREQGNVARSQDLSAAALLLGAVILLSKFGDDILKTMKNIVETLLSEESLADHRIPDLTALFGDLAWRTFGALWPLMLGIVIIGIAVNILQVGLFFSTKKITPNFAALNPTRGLSRMFSGGKGFVTLAMNVTKLIMIVAVAYSAIHDRIGTILNAQVLETSQIFLLGGQTMYDIALRIAVLLLVLAILDYAYQRFRIEKELKMTKQEVKDEMRRMEGDPHIKQRRRQLQMQRAVQRIRQDVPTADVVVTNPTHFAVALKYEKDMRAPKVVAKGADFLAFRIREVAGEHGIPILERPPLARALYRDVEVGQEIPEEFYATVAEILAYVYELTGKVRRRQTAMV